MDFQEQINKLLTLPSPLYKMEDNLFLEKKLNVFIKRDDLIHPEISGNKWRKLKYNLLHAKAQGFENIVTFGGAYSNHIYATAAAGKYFGFETTGIIRGDELNENSSTTLKFAAECGMKLHFISRNDYRALRTSGDIHSFTNGRRTASVIQPLIIPEGGTNEFALGGVGEMVREIESQLGFAPDYIICPVGTGGTIAGIIAHADQKSKVLGICVLKNGQYLENEIKSLLSFNLSLGEGRAADALEGLFLDFHHGGYAKKTPQLQTFIEAFEAKYNFKIEPVYSGKMFFAFDELLKNDYFPLNSTIVLVHTGGLR